jgi:D-alanyl-D-alanine carboxypeptidase (penicillin-binding protein 5/6)
MEAAAFKATTTLLDSARRMLSRRVVIKRGTTLGSLSAPWADPVPLLADRSMTLVGWPALPVHKTIRLAQVRTPVSTGAAVGTMLLDAGRQRAKLRLITSKALPGPSLAWRLTNP